MENKLKKLEKLLRKTQQIQKERPELKGFEALEEAKKQLKEEK